MTYAEYVTHQLDDTCYFISLLCTQHVSDINISIIRSLRLCCWITTSHQICNTQRTKNKTTDVVIQQHSRKLLMMDILMCETCWARKKWNKIASDTKLVFYSSTITMMNGPINICNTHSDQLKVAKFYTAVSLLLDSCIMPSHCSGYTSAHWGKKLWKTPHIVH